MRYLVNGSEVDLEDSGTPVQDLGDRLAVQGPEGWATALSLRTGDSTWVSYRGSVYEVEKPGAARSKRKHHSTGEAHAPMPGQVVDVIVEQGQQVEAGDRLLVLEAMKMQHAVLAPFRGIVRELPVHRGDQVTEGQLLALVEPDNESTVPGT